MNSVSSSPNDTISTAIPKNKKLSHRLSDFLKRGLDILASFLGLLVLSPFFLYLAIRIKRESPGPVFYRGLRTGRDGRNFRIVKFRTMRECPEIQNGSRVTAQNDPRITPLGRWLRETKLNELPQLWNVLKGEMSLVGPRPEDPEIANTWPEEVRRKILSVRPGITSPASVLYRHEEQLLNGGNVMDEYLQRILPDKLRLDLLYVHNHDLLADLDVLLWTIIALLPALARKPIRETRLYAGPLSHFIRRYISWFMVDGVVAFGAVGVVGLMWRMRGPLDLGIGVALGLAVMIALFFAIINSLLGLKKISWRSASPLRVFDLAFSSGLATLIVLFIEWIWPFGLTPDMLIVTGVLAFLGFVAVRYRGRLITGLASRWVRFRSRKSPLGEHVLIVGSGECGQLADWLLQKSHFGQAFSIIGSVDDDLQKQGLEIDGCPVLGMTGDIPELARKKDIGLILYAITNVQPADQERILTLCRQTQARVIIIPDLLQIFRDSLLREPVREDHEELLVQ